MKSGPYSQAHQPLDPSLDNWEMGLPVTEKMEERGKEREGSLMRAGAGHEGCQFPMGH